MRLTSLALLLVSTSLAAADDGKPAATDAKLAQLVGHWEGSSEFVLAGKKSTWKVTTSCERAAVSPAILCSSVGVSGDMRLEELWMLGTDQQSSTYHLFMTNNWGEAYDHAAKWTDASAVSFVHTGTRDGKALVETYALSVKGDDMTWKGSLKVGGKVVGEGTTTIKRVK